MSGWVELAVRLILGPPAVLVLAGALAVAALLLVAWWRAPKK